jgi:hypothetical protein
LILSCNLPCSYSAESIEPSISSFLRRSLGTPYFQNLRKVYIQNDFVCTLDTLVPFLPLLHLRALAVDKLQDGYQEGDSSAGFRQWHSRIPDATSALQKLFFLDAYASRERIGQFIRKCRSLRRIVWQYQRPKPRRRANKYCIHNIDLKFEPGDDFSKIFEEKISRKF